MGPILNGLGVMNIFNCHKHIRLYCARKSCYATINQLEQSAAAATSAVHNRAAAWLAAGGGIFENPLKAQVSGNKRR